MIVWDACQSASPCLSLDVVISNVNVLDSQSGWLTDMTVTISADSIVNVRSSSIGIEACDGWREIDGTGRYLIPGLWDAHMHFGYLEELAPAMLDLFLIHGITSIRDTGGDLDFVKKWKEKAQSNPTAYPHVYIAGPLVDGTPNVYDGSGPGIPALSVENRTPSEVANLVNHLADQGVDFIKAYEMLTADQHEALIQTAESRGLPVTGHVPLSMDALTAAQAGLHCIEHLRNIELAVSTDHEELLAQRLSMLEDGRHDIGRVLRTRIHTAQRSHAINHPDSARTRQLIDTFRELGIWQVPTLSIMTSMTRRPYLEDEWRKDFELLPDVISEAWISRSQSIAERPITEDQIAYERWMISMVGQMHEAGVKFMAGTDCPIAFLTPGRSLHHELALLVESGLSPLDAIVSATIHPAEYFGIDDEHGYIKKGYIADLVLLDQDPLADITHTRSIRSVIKSGRVIDHKAMAFGYPY